MRVYMVPRNDLATANDVEACKRFAESDIKVAVVNELTYPDIRPIVGLLALPACKGLLMPDDYHRHNPLMDTVKLTARLMKLEVLPLRVFLKKQTQPVAASAVPATQHPAVAGHNTPTTA